MAKKNSRNTKGKIVTSAWKLFYNQGYDDTTVEEIIEDSGTSRGSFYHYFEGKDALLGTLSILFDEKYESLAAEMDPSMNSFDKLIYMNYELFAMVENRVSLDLLARLIASQLTTKGDKHLLDHNRVYYRVLRAVVSEGQQRGEISSCYSVSEIVKVYAMCERSLMYDWCLCNGEYSLREYASKMMPLFIRDFRV